MRLLDGGVVTPWIEPCWTRNAVDGKNRVWTSSFGSEASEKSVDSRGVLDYTYKTLNIVFHFSKNYIICIPKELNYKDQVN